MAPFPWERTSLIDRIRWLRYVLPPMLVLVVIIYQLGFAQSLERNYGPLVHYGVEIGFYSLVGPIAAFLMLVWVERRLLEKEQLERRMQSRTKQLASLTATSADAILSLNSQQEITSWNRGAERMLGYHDSDIVGKPLSYLLPEANVLAVHLREQGEVKDFEAKAISKTGRKLTVELTQTRLTQVDEAAAASLIIMRDVTVRREREAIREEERARIARDLHDGVAQTLYFMALKADSAREKVVQEPDKIAAELKEIGQTARRVIREVRRTIFALRPLSWTDTEFASGLTRFIEELAEQVGWQAVIDINGEQSVPPALEPTVFRLIQESLNNAAKHAEANRVWVSLREIDNAEMLSLSVRDDGIGFDPDNVTNGGLGLNQMKERVSAMGGKLRVESRPGEGTTVGALLFITR